jgi:uridine phosphorylase
MVVGISGAVDDVIPIGTVVAPAVVTDGAGGEQFVPGPVPGVSQRGTLWTSDVLVTDLARVAELRASGVVALDMETAAIARECQARQIGWSVLRAISDRATDGSVDAAIFALNHMDGSPDPVAIARYVLARPSRVALLAKLARDSRVAVNAAADAAIGACQLGWAT